jgi:uncharacterized protein (DUF2267 family)
MKLFQNASEMAGLWVEQMAGELGIRDQAEALAALRAGLQALRDRLGVEEVAQLSAQLPLLVRGLLFENWDPTGKPLRLRHRDQFLALVRDKYAPRWQLSPEQIIQALFRLLEAHVSRGEITHIMLALPREIGALARGGEREELR